jgi:hypothetical protein
MKINLASEIKKISKLDFSTREVALLILKKEIDSLPVEDKADLELQEIALSKEFLLEMEQIHKDLDELKSKAA